MLEDLDEQGHEASGLDLELLLASPPSKGITQAKAEAMAATISAHRAVMRSVRPALPPTAPLELVPRTIADQLAELPRELRRVAAALSGGRGAVSEAEVQELARRLGGGAVRMVPLRELADAQGVAVRTLQTRALQGQLPGAVRGRDSRWYVVQATSEPCQASSPASPRASEGAPVRRPR